MAFIYLMESERRNVSYTLVVKFACREKYQFLGINILWYCRFNL